MSVEHIKKILDEFVDFPYSSWTSFLPESHSDAILQVGGDCIEINSRLQKVLEEYGYKTTMLVQKSPIKIKRHHILVVTIPGEELPFYVDARLRIVDPIEMSNHNQVYPSFPVVGDQQASVRLIMDNESAFTVRYEFGEKQVDFNFDTLDSESPFTKDVKNQKFKRSRFFYTSITDRETGTDYRLNFAKKRGLLSVQVNGGTYVNRGDNTVEFERLFNQVQSSYQRIIQVNREFLHLRTDFDFTIDNLEKYFKIALG